MVGGCCTAFVTIYAPPPKWMRGLAKPIGGPSPGEAVLKGGTERWAARQPPSHCCSYSRYSAGAMYDSAPAADILLAAGIDPDALGELMPRVDPSQVKVRVASPRFRRLWAKGIAAVALPNGVFVQPSVMERIRAGAEPDRSGKLIVHELMHIEQWRRLGAFRHVTQYTGDYLRGRFGGLGHWDSYRAIRLEVEARSAASQISDRGMR